MNMQQPHAIEGVTPLTATIQVTKWTSSQPITKKLALQPDGSISKVSTANHLYEGDIARLELTAEGFAELLANGIGQNDCLSYGNPRNAEAKRLVTKKLKAASGNQVSVLARTTDEMMWPTGPAILMVDYDPGDQALSKDELLAAIYQIVPVLRQATHIWAASTSSCLYNSETGEEVRGIRGQRVYIAVANGADIPRAGQVLAKRAWLLGYGYIKISSAGSMLVRGLVDEAVFQPNRIDYCAPPICISPLVSRKPEPQLLGSPGLALESRSAIPDLTPAEEADYQRLVQAAKQAIRPEAEQIKANYTAKRVKELVDRGVDPVIAEQTIAKAVDQQLLLGDFPLVTQSGTVVTVADILADKASFHAQHFHDPIEPDYHDDPRIARAYLLGPGRPYIHSFAHGGRRNYLARHIQTIRLQKGERASYAEEIIQGLLKTGEIYRRGGSLVVMDEHGRVDVLTPHKLLAILDCLFRFEKSLRNAWQPADAPIDLAFHLLEAHATSFQPLKSVLTAQSMAPLTGRLLNQPGYDAETQSYLIPSDSAIVVPLLPTMEEIKEALCRLWWPVHRVPFENDVDMSVMLTAMLTAVVRPLLPTAPAFAFDAPTQASGKTLLCKVLSTLMGQVPVISPQTDSNNDEELRKRLFSLLLGGVAVMIIDNVVGEFDSPTLAAMLTSETFSDRILKESRTAAVPTNCLVLLSGNNFIPKGDLPRRVLRCRINPGIENPHQREFDFDPVEVVKENRDALIVAALTLFVGYLQAKPESRIGAGRTASFETWDDLVRQTVCWLVLLQQQGRVPKGDAPGEEHYPSLVDPMDAIDAAMKQDPARTLLGRLLDIWAVTVGCGNSQETTITVRQLITFAESPAWNPRRLPRGSELLDENEAPTLRDVLFEIAGGSQINGINVRTLARKLPGFKDRITDGLCLRSGPERQNTASWWVEDVSQSGSKGFEGLISSDARKNAVVPIQVASQKKATKALKAPAKDPASRNRATPSRKELA